MEAILALILFNIVRIVPLMILVLWLDLVDPLLEPCVECYNVPIVNDALGLFFFIQFHLSDCRDDRCYPSVHLAISPYFFNFFSMRVDQVQLFFCDKNCKYRT